MQYVFLKTMSITIKRFLKRLIILKWLKVTVLRPLWILRGIKLWLSYWGFRKDFPQWLLYIGCCQGSWLFAQNQFMFSGRIALLMEQEPNPRMWEDEPSGIVTKKERPLLEVIGYFLCILLPNHWQTDY